jgi:hypothetical protein
MDLPGPAVHLRRILVHSPANAAGEAKRCPETDVMRAYTRPPSPGLIRTESAFGVHLARTISESGHFL